MSYHDVYFVSLPKTRNTKKAKQNKTKIKQTRVDECRSSDSEVSDLGLGNQVNQVSGQFSYFNDPKWGT